MAVDCFFNVHFSCVNSHKSAQKEDIRSSQTTSRELNFPATYHIPSYTAVMHTILSISHSDCRITTCLLVKETFGEMLEQSIIIPITDSTNWISSLTYFCLGKWQTACGAWTPVTWMQPFGMITPWLREEITHAFGESTTFTKVGGTLLLLFVVLDCESSYLTTFKLPIWMVQFFSLPFQTACAQNIFQHMVYQLLDRCDGAAGMVNDITVHGKDCNDHKQNLHKFMHIAHDYSLVLNSCSKGCLICII